MGNLVFQATLGGQVNLVGPNTASTFNLDVPAVSGTIVATGTSPTFTAVTTPTVGSASGASLVLQTNGGTTAVTVDTAQNVGVGVTPSAWGGPFKAIQSGNGGSAVGFQTNANVMRLFVNNFYNGTNYVYTGSAAASQYTCNSDGSFNWQIAASGTAGNAISFTQAMTLDASGNLLVGTTSTDSGAKTRIVYGSGANGLQLKDSADTSNTAFVIFQNGSNSNIGTISRVGTTNVVAYNTTSDERLKNDLGVATTDSVIDALVIHDFTWKTDGTVDRGVFAQEAALVKPLAVREGSDEVDENGIPKNPWGVDYSKFVPDLIVHAQQLKKQVQEQQAIITQLQADVAALKAA